MTPLAANHQKILDESAIATAVSEARGYRTVSSSTELRELGFSEAQARNVPCLLHPSYNLAGKLFPQIRPDNPPLDASGKPIKYQTPKDGGYCLDVHPSLHEKVQDVSIPLYVTEGVRKADAAISVGLCCVALTGVWMWRVSKGIDPKTPPLPDWDAIPLKGRTVYVAFDSDAMTKSEVNQACQLLGRFLRSRGAIVLFLYLPDADEDAKVGLDDYLAQGHSVAELLSLAETKLRVVPTKVEEALVGSLTRRLRGLATVTATSLDFNGRGKPEDLKKIGRGLTALAANLAGVSKETRQKISESQKLAWAKRKAEKVAGNG